MQNNSTLLGTVQDVRGTTVSVTINDESLIGLAYVNGEGYRIGQIGSFIKIPIGYNDLFGIISQVGASALPEKLVQNFVFGNRWITIQLIGEGNRNGRFERGISQYPTIGDSVHLVSEEDLTHIYGKQEKPYYINIGHVAGSESIPALLDVNKLVNRHCAVLGTTGSGKSTTVATIINSLSDTTCFPSSRILIFDLHGEYSNALSEKATVFKVLSETNTSLKSKQLYVPFWALSYDEMLDLALGSTEEKDKAILSESVYKLKYKTADTKKYDGIELNKLSVDTPVPFSINRLWLHICRQLHSTHNIQNTGQKFCDIAAPFDAGCSTELFKNDTDGKPLIGDADKIIKPTYEPQQSQKVFLSGSSLNIRRQFDNLTSKLKDPRYDFLFKPGDWTPDLEGNVTKDLDELYKDWLGGEKPITILDLSGVPQGILNTLIGALLRVLYEGVFWSRNLSQGGRNRPLMLVMEEAHNYLNDNVQSSCSATVQRIVKEGRKYGIGVMVVSQRPSEINSTILSQCGTFISLRLSNSIDKSHVTSSVSDNLEGLTNMLPLLKTGEAIILGEAVKLPMRAIIDSPPRHKRPDSQDPVVIDEINSNDSLFPGGWSIKMEKAPNYKEFAETVRSQNPVIKRVKQ